MKNRPLIIIEPQAHKKLNPSLIRGTTKIAMLGDKLWNARLRSYGHLKKREEGYMGKRIMKCQVEGKEESQGEGGCIWREKTWKGLELGRETKSIGSNGEYFSAVATPNREK